MTKIQADPEEDEDQKNSRKLADELKKQKEKDEEKEQRELAKQKAQDEEDDDKEFKHTSKRAKYQPTSPTGVL